MNENRYTYTAREWDEDVQMYYFRARWYDPEIARFTQEDPIYSSNLYAYVGNSPVKHIDPLGLWEYAEEHGTTGEGLTDEILNIEESVDAVTRNVTGSDAVVTYTTNGKHTNNSRHYSGDAIDIRTRNMKKDERLKVTDDLKATLGDQYYVLDEKNHIHIQYNRRRKKLDPYEKENTLKTHNYCKL